MQLSSVTVATKGKQTSRVSRACAAGHCRVARLQITCGPRLRAEQNRQQNRTEQNRMERELYSKIELGTDDVRYLRDELLKAGNDKLALHLPSSEEDPLKARVNEHVRGFINKIFEMGRYSMVVDGEDMSEHESLVKVLDDREEKIEPFDSELNARLRQVYDQVDKKTLEVSNLRRTVPRKVVDEYSSGADANRALTDDKNGDNEDDENRLDEHEWMDLDDEEMEETRQTYYEALETLNRMKDAVPTSEAELKNLQSVLDHLRGPSQTD